MKRVLRYVLALLGIVMGVLVVWGWLIHEQGRRELEEVRAKIRAEGGALTFEDLGLEPGEIKTEGFVKFSGQVGELKEAATLAEKQTGKLNFTTERMGRVRLICYSTPGQLGVKTGLDWRQIHEVYAPMVQQWDAGWAIFREEDVRYQPAYDKGMQAGFDHISTVFPWCRFGQLLAWLDLQRGDLQGALQRIEACKRVEDRLLGEQKQTLVEALVSATIENVGAISLQQLVEAPGLDESQLDQMADICGKPDALAMLADGLRGERVISGEWMWNYLRKDPGKFMVELSSLGDEKTGRRGDWSVHLFMVLVYRPFFMNGDQSYSVGALWGAERAARSMAEGRESYRQVVPAFAVKPDREEEESNLFKICPVPVSTLTLASVDKAAQNMVRYEVSRRQLRIAIALKRYQLKHGEYPERLEELELDPELDLRDPMTLEPMCYRRDEKVGYELYSRGLDGKDDGGVAVPREGKDGKILRDIDAPDWLWPRPLRN